MTVTWNAEVQPQCKSNNSNDLIVHGHETARGDHDGAHPKVMYVINKYGGKTLARDLIVAIFYQNDS